MKTIVISAKNVSGTIGLIICYSISLYLFWNSQISLSDFRVGPEHSHFTRFLHKIFGYGQQGYPNKSIGIITAFLSIHLSWSLRYKAGYFIEALLQRYLLKDSGKIIDSPLREEEIVEARASYDRLDTYISIKSQETKDNIVSLGNSRNNHSKH